MPQNKKNSTLLRQWEMMRALSVSRFESKDQGLWHKVIDITADLNAKGYSVSKRTVQRDLIELSEIFGAIELNDTNPRDYGWRWSKGWSFDIPGMGVSEALAMRLVEMHLQQLLPSAMLDGLQGVFSMAQNKLNKLEQENNKHAKNWLNKIRVVSPTQTMLPPSVDQKIQADIYQALLENRQIKANYQSASSGQNKEYQLHPLGLIMRGAVSYLVASAWDFLDPRLYALHRFNKVEILDAEINTPDGFKLDEAIAAGLADFAYEGAPIQLEIRCAEWVAAMLRETPLAVDQMITQEDDGRMRLTATVNDTWQLRWWLMGQGAGVEVSYPAYLRTEIRSAFADAASLYDE